MKKFKHRDFTSIDAILGNFAGRPMKYIIIIVSLVIVLFPLYWLLTSSFKLEQEYLAYPPVIIPSVLTLDSYIEVFTRDKILSTFINSTIVTVMTTLVTVFAGSMAAYSVARGPIGTKAKNFFGLWFLIQKMYPAIATAIPVYLVMRKLHLIDTRLSLIIMNTSFNLPLVIWLMMGFFEQIPYSLEESAILDGCSFSKRFFWIILPITKPGLVASAILTFVATWNEFLFAVILSIKKTKTMPVVIAGFITDRGLAWGPMAATAVLTLLPVVILAWFVQKDFITGLAMGAVKG